MFLIVNLMKIPEPEVFWILFLVKTSEFAPGPILKYEIYKCERW